eukprot:9483778-Pyramimonas_sp.AAC.1
MAMPAQRLRCNIDVTMTIYDNSDATTTIHGNDGKSIRSETVMATLLWQPVLGGASLGVIWHRLAIGHDVLLLRL